MLQRLKILLICILAFSQALPVSGQENHSVARTWNEMLLFSIRNDLARPTVHARNLFHISAAMYDCWAAYENEADTYFLGKWVDGFHSPFIGVNSNDKKIAQEMAISYAAYRLIAHRFRRSVGARVIRDSLLSMATRMNIDPSFTSRDYEKDGPAALGNYVAQQIIEYGITDGANENLDYANVFYDPINEALSPAIPGNTTMTDPNRWQPLSLDLFIDQSGNPIPFNTPPFLSPEWGFVHPFAMGEAERTQKSRDGEVYQMYYDPGPPPLLGSAYDSINNENYKWGFCLVSQWSSHLDTTSEVLIDISPRSMGNVRAYPDSWVELQSFYNIEGGDPGIGYFFNPIKAEPYVENIVPRSDFARVVAEYWADGPDSETPPGHWFTLLNRVSDHPEFKQKLEGKGDILDRLEWDVKVYFALGGAMHDAAVSVWGVKGFYDYLRPISAIRYMAEQGQSTTDTLPNYNENGITLIPGYIEMVTENDPLAGASGENIDKIKLFTWKGPDFIESPETDAAGVGWILAENWWPYQRPTFVTPNFAGYVSGHSTFSSAAAEVLTLLTGSPYFPGGLGTFTAKKNEFLVFEEGPSVDVELQWATYKDAANQSALSRIWGGIHPPADDIPGRLMGTEIGIKAAEKAFSYFKNMATSTSENFPIAFKMYPNPAQAASAITLEVPEKKGGIYNLIDSKGMMYQKGAIASQQNEIFLPEIPAGVYFLRLMLNGKWTTQRLIIMD